MVSRVCPQTTSEPIIDQGNDIQENISSIRACVNWEKVIVFSNSALLLAGIAATFFMNLPLVMLGLGVYGTLYLLLQPLADRQHAQIVDAKPEELTRHVNKLKDEVANLQAIKKQYHLEALEAKKIRNEHLTKKDLDHIAERSVKMARGMAAEKWLTEEYRKAEKDNSELSQKLKELGAVMVKAGEELS